MRAKPRLYTRFKRAGSWSTVLPLEAAHRVRFPTGPPIILQEASAVATDKPELKPTRDMEEKVKIDLDPDVALQALLQVDPNSQETISKLNKGSKGVGE